MGNRLPGPILEEDRLAAVDIHQLRAGHWSCSEQYLHRIGRRPTPGCERCNDVECPAARCRVCREEVDTPRHVLLRCPALLAGRRLRCLGTINPEATDVRDDGVVAALDAGFRAQLSLLGYAPWGAGGATTTTRFEGSNPRGCTFFPTHCRCCGWVDLLFRCRFR